MQLRDIALACGPPALWALSYALAKPALEHFPPIFLTSQAYAAAALIRLFRSQRGRKRRGGLWSSSPRSVARCKAFSSLRD